MKLFCLVLTCMLVRSFARHSSWKIVVKQDAADHFSFFPNILYKDSFVSVTMVCHTHNLARSQLRVQWVLQQLKCMEELYDYQTEITSDMLKLMGDTLLAPTSQNSSLARDRLDPNLAYSTFKFQKSTQFIECGLNNVVFLEDESDYPYHIAHVPIGLEGDAGSSGVVVEEVCREENMTTEAKDRVTRVWEDGLYHFMLAVSPVERNQSFENTMFVQMHGSFGYLSADAWPLLPVSGTLAILYLLISTGWVIVWGRAHLSTYRIHVIIGAIAVGGALSQTLQFIEYATLNSNGQGVTLIMWVAKLLDAAQMCLLYLVLMIVSMGYGITRPTMSRCTIGSAITLASLYFLLTVTRDITLDQTLEIQFVVPVVAKMVMWFAVVMGIIVHGWVLVAAISTVTHLYKRRHSAKLVAFGSLMGICIASFIGMFVVSVLNMDWMRECRTDWKHEWLFVSFSKIVAMVLLVVLMGLWRPADQADSYAFSPLVTTEEDDDEVTEFEKLSLDEL